MNYQWRKNGTNVPGATSSSYTISNTQTNDSGSYNVIAYNASGSITSAVASLTVLGPTPPVITAQPISQMVYPEQSVSFSVAVTGEAPLHYQWRLNGSDISNATNATYTIPFVRFEHVGSYSVRITNNLGQAISSNAQLTLIDSPYVNSVSVRAGLRSAIVSWNTTIPADAQVDFGPVQDGGITGSSPRNNTVSTNHSVLLSGLQPSTTYNYQVVSRNNGTNYLSAVYQFTTLGDPVVVDNADLQRMTYSAGWNDSTSVSGYYGSNYRWASTNSVNSSPARTATFTPSLPAPGLYDVAVWYTAGVDRATNAPYVIFSQNGSQEVRVNQQANSNQWYPLLSNVPFAAGNSGYVRLGSNASGRSSGSSVVVIADAVRFNYVAEQDMPSNGSVPAWWSSFYFPGSADPSVDHDGDGYTTGQEYILGTDPTSSNSGLNVNVFRSGATANVMFHPFHADRVYTLQQRANLAGASWQNVSAEPIAVGPDGNAVFSLSLTNASQNFYRISVALGTPSAAMAARDAQPLERRMFVGTFAEPSCGPTRI
ncbi:MAG: immunoglobulin domain-containing protein, partial [Limisphaerales bacterium]